MIGYLWYLLVERFATAVPMRTAYAMARFLGVLRYWQWRKGRRYVRRNIEVLLDGKAPRGLMRSLVRRTFINFGLNIIEFFRFKRFDKEYFDTHCEIFGAEYLDEALARGRGAIFLSAHFGNWELGVAAYAAHGRPITVIAMPHLNAKVERLFVEQRGKKGLGVLPTRTAARPAVRILRNNGIIGMLGERTTGDDGVAVDFCGRRVLFPKGPGWLAVKTGAAIMPTLGIRKRDNTFTIFSDPPIYPPESGTDDERILTVTRRFASFLERYVKRYPELWATFLDFFARQSAEDRVEADN
jgi:KDO2-lipid IV(A) lauroyltransferase